MAVRFGWGLTVGVAAMLAACGGGSGGGSGGSADPVTSVSTAISIPATPAASATCDDTAATKASGLFTVYSNCLAYVRLGTADFNTLVSKPETDISSLIQDFRSAFADRFDFVMYVLDTGTTQPATGTYGLYRSRNVRLPVRSERLMGSLLLPYSDGIPNGPVLHELAHEWVTKGAVPYTFNGATVDESHWGASSAGGQLGGFDMLHFKDEGGGRYSGAVEVIFPTTTSTAAEAVACSKLGAESTVGFGLNANGGNTVPYSTPEMYLMGLLPSASFVSLLVARNPRTDPVWFNSQPPNKNYFLADGFTVYSEADIRSRLGSRAPAVNQGQRDLRVATVVIGTGSGLSATARTNYMNQIRQLALRGNNDAMTQSFTTVVNGRTTSVKCLVRQNFYTATGGAATLSVGGLADALL